MAQNGYFITLEGGEGAGKSTLARGLVAHLETEGHTIVLTREPGGVPSAEAIRKLVLTPEADAGYTALTETLLFNAARNEHLERLIRPSLTEGKLVLCDRFADSTRAYQIAGAAELTQQVALLESMIVGPTAPDLTLILDLPTEVGRARMRTRGEAPDAFEQRDRVFHEAVRAAFLEIARLEPERCVVLDATRSADEILAEAVKTIQTRLNQT